MQYAKTACSHTPMLRCTPALANTERDRHSIQAAFGAACLSRLLGKTVKACVLVSCNAGVCVAYMVPARYQMATMFMRLVRATPALCAARPRAKQHRVATKRQRRIKPPSPWPGGVADTCGMLCGVRFEAKTATAKIRVVTRAGAPVGVVLHAADWAQANASRRGVLGTMLRRHALAKIKGSNNMITPMVLCPQSRGGRLQLIMAGAPFRL